MRSSLRTPYLLLFILLGSCFIVYFLTPGQFSWLQSFSLDLASEIFGILLVVFSIDRAIAIDREKERQKLESVAFLQLRRPLRRHLYLFFNMFKAATSEKPDRDYQKVSNLFDDVFFDQIAYLDFSKPAPIFNSVDASWSDYLYRECAQFKESLNRTMEKYCLFLQPELIDLMEEMINSPFLWLVFNAPAIRQFGNRNDASTSYNLLAREEIRGLMREYTKLLVELFEQYNQRVPEAKQLTIGDELWENDVPPRIASGRFTQDKIDSLDNAN
jgi:hypothetical protein